MCPFQFCIAEHQPVTVGDEQNGFLDRDSVTRLQFTGPREGVAVRVCIDQGAIVVYGSYTSTNPSSALHDFSTILRAGGGEVSPSSCLVSHATIDDIMRSPRDCSQCGPDNLFERRKRRQSDDEEEMVTIYITIEGVSNNESHFSVNSSFGDLFGRAECVHEFIQPCKTVYLPLIAECAAADNYSCGEYETLNRRDGNCLCECVPGYQRQRLECLSNMAISFIIM